MPLHQPVPGLPPDAYVEADGLLLSAAEAYKQSLDGPLLGRSWTGEIIPITAVSNREVETCLVTIEHEALPWPLVVSVDTPVLVSSRTTDWRA